MVDSHVRRLWFRGRQGCVHAMRYPSSWAGAWETSASTNSSRSPSITCCTGWKPCSYFRRLKAPLPCISRVPYRIRPGPAGWRPNPRRERCFPSGQSAERRPWISVIILIVFQPWPFAWRRLSCGTRGVSRHSSHSGSGSGWPVGCSPCTCPGPCYRCASCSRKCDHIPYSLRFGVFALMSSRSPMVSGSAGIFLCVRFSTGLGLAGCLVFGFSAAFALRFFL